MALLVLFAATAGAGIVTSDFFALVTDQIAGGRLLGIAYGFPDRRLVLWPLSCAHVLIWRGRHVIASLGRS